jgi:hypothetical protein
MASEILEIERDLNGQNYLIEVEVWANLVSGAFDHAFGTHDPGPDIEVDQVDILTVYNNNGEVITDRETIKKLEKEIDVDDFNDVEFDFSE